MTERTGRTLKLGELLHPSEGLLRGFHAMPLNRKFHGATREGSLHISKGERKGEEGCKTRKPLISLI